MLLENIKLSTKTREFLSNVEGSLKTVEGATQVIETLAAYRKGFLFYEMAKNILEGLEESKVDLEGMQEKVIENLTAVQTGREAGESIFHFGKDRNSESLVKDIIHGEDDDSFIPTGYKAWDNRNGGFPRGALVMLAGSTGAGKSHNMNQLMINQARKGYKVAGAPLEMSAKGMTARYLANVSGIDSLKILRKQLATAEKELCDERDAKFNRIVAKRGGRLTIVEPGGDVTIEELLAILHSLNADINYIDYVSLLKGADGDDQWRKLGAIARYCAVYAKNSNKTIVLLAQVTDEGRLKYSQTMREHANLMWSFTATKESKEEGYLKYNVDKSRNQDGRPFSMKVDYSISRVYDFEGDQDQDGSESGKDEPLAKTKSKKGNSKQPSNLPDLTE